MPVVLTQAADRNPELGGLEPRPPGCDAGTRSTARGPVYGSVEPDPGSGRSALARADVGISPRMSEDLGTGGQLVPRHDRAPASRHCFPSVEHAATGPTTTRATRRS